MQAGPDRIAGQVIPFEKPLPELAVAPAESRARKSKFSWRLRHIILLGLAVYLLVVFGGIKLEMHRANQQILLLEQEKEQLLAEQARLIKGKTKMDNPILIERRAREALGLIKPGEKVILPAEPGQVIGLKLEGINEIGD